jgi:hypothetical protein
MEEQIFGGHSITEEMYSWITKVLPEGKTLLELGSGRATELFTQKYKVYSVEDDPYWVDATESTYIYAPLVNDEWYDADILKAELPEEYDLLLVDGPRTQDRRLHILKHLDLFRKDVPWIFDDVNQPKNLDTFLKAAEMTGREYLIVEVGAKTGGIIYPEGYVIST